MNPFSVEPSLPNRRRSTGSKRRRSPIIGAAIGASVILLAVGIVAVVAASNDPDRADVPIGPGMVTSTTNPVVSPVDPSTPTSSRPGGGQVDANGALFTNCNAIPGRFPVAERTCTIVSPPAVKASERMPAIILLHGLNNDPSMVITNGGWSDQVVKHRILVAVPKGVLSSWNAGGCCAPATALQIDDVSFLREIVRQIKNRPDVDPTRVFMVGESNGGMMMYRYLCEGAGELVAAASVEGTPIAGCSPSQSMSILHIHGTADMTVPYQGGQSLASFVLGVTFPAVETSVTAVATANRCNPVPEQTTNGGVATSRWSGCGNGSQVELVTVSGLGHVWPNAPVFPATEAIMGFFGLA